MGTARAVSTVTLEASSGHGHGHDAAVSQTRDDVTSTLERIRQLKTGAKNQRDRGLRGYPRALSSLEEAIAAARAELEAALAPERRAAMAAELSDCFGLVGGLHRRWADEVGGADRVQHLTRSVQAYDDGFSFERDPQYGIVNSYNLVNRLLVRLLIAPGALEADDVSHIAPEIPPLNVPRELDSAAAIIRTQLTGPRLGDYWAMADLALIEVLLQRASPAVAFADFVNASPPDFALLSAIGTIGALAQLPIASRDGLRAAADHLQARLDALRA